ncbi:kinesin-like protein KIF6 [Brachionichthys hirsutus]|uniref:kinesin-like protein KIF6 n=1 Tax=Brachionichthys hirsutus TaxID=412623 RepID=UPI0036046189
MVKQTIEIFARIRPTKAPAAVYSVVSEEQIGASLEFTVPRDLDDGFVNNKRERYKFRFQKIFDQAAEQEEIFENIAKPVADSVLAGFNGTIFAYGQTGSGKTFTITGGAERYHDRGIVPRTLSYLYTHLSQGGGVVYSTHVSYLEVYNETGYDLLDPRSEASRLEDLPKVTILEDPDQNIHLRNLSLQQSANEEEALNLLFLGDTNRMIAETPMNQASTRSHCIFTVHLSTREPGSATVRRSKLHLVDLAGSERASKTGLNGQLLTEAKYINLSLHYLEQVIIALSERNRSHVPYRNSMLTSVLRDSLGGNCMTTMIATIAVDKRNLEESISTCRFAQRVALIKNEAVLNEELEPALEIARLKREIQSLKEELALVMGEQRNEQLTAEEVHKMKESVQVFLDDPDPSMTLSLGPDMRKIQCCFSLLKTMVINKEGRGGNECCDGPAAPAATGEEADPERAAEADKFKKMLAQRDDEISILIKMVKKERRRAEDAAARLVNVSNGRIPPCQSASPPSTGASVTSAGGGRAARCKRTGPPVGKQEAFEAFIKDHEDHVTIEDNKTLLRQRADEARALGKEMIEARKRINELKRQLAMQRRQRVASGVMGTHAEAAEEVDPADESLRRRIEQEKNAYKSTVGRLKALRAEIEHLQLLLERSKAKLQKGFQELWSQETQESESEATDSPRGELLPSSPGAAAPRTSGVTRTAAEPPAGHKENCSNASDQGLRTFLPGGAAPVTAVPSWRAGPLEGGASDWSSSRALPSAPLTGDQQLDAGVLAFVRARQILFSRTGPPH